MKILMSIFMVCIITYTHTHTTHDDLKTAHIRQPQTKQERVYTGNLQMQAGLRYAKLEHPKKTCSTASSSNKPFFVISSIIVLQPQPNKDSLCQLKKS